MVSNKDDEFFPAAGLYIIQHMTIAGSTHNPPRFFSLSGWLLVMQGMRWKLVKQKINEKGEKKKEGKREFHPIKKLLRKHLYVSTMKEGDQVKIRN